jgi:hypothetical protein
MCLYKVWDYPPYAVIIEHNVTFYDVSLFVSTYSYYLRQSECNIAPQIYL